MHVLSWCSYEHANINPLNAKLNPICHLLALLGAHHILHISRIRVEMVLSFDAYYYDSETLIFKLYVGPVTNMIIF